MRISYNWLKDYLDLDLPSQDLGDRLTMVGLEVEEIEDRYAYLEDVLAARIASVEKHPHSDHLKVCRVETGGQVVQVVCGAPNTRAGMISAWARPGTELPLGQKVGDSEIRGVRSVGMLCSEAELFVGPDASGIVSLSDGAVPGRSIKEALGLEDWIYELGITPNRPDCLCVLGVAREVAGILHRPLRYPSLNLVEEPPGIQEVTSVKVLDPDHCPRYVARVIMGVSIGASPFWLADRLMASGVRPINNIVDITNYVLLETGQPQHAFDLDRLEEHRIVVRLAEPGSRFTTLDGTERTMGQGMLMICDGVKPVGLAGVMGGLNSEIVTRTTNVLLESAYFNPLSIRRTSKALGLSTEASFRFERGIDPEVCLFATNRAIALMAELAGGTVLKGLIDEDYLTHQKVVVPFSPAKCNAFLGTGFTPQEMTAGLEDIQLEVSGRGEDLKVAIPTFRVDLTREVDLFEEVARLIGFDQVPTTIPPARAELKPFGPSLELRRQARNILEGLGLSEVVNYSFISEAFPDRLNLPEGDQRRRVVRIINPLSEEQAWLRTTLVPGLLDTLRRNRAYGVRNIGLYEIGIVFFRSPGENLPEKQCSTEILPEERWHVSGLLSGSMTDLSWSQKNEPADFYDLKGVVEGLLEGLGVPSPRFQPGRTPSYYEPAVAATLASGGNILGWLGLVSPAVAEAFGLKAAGWDPIFIFELDAAAILAVKSGVPQFQPLARYPSVARDLAVILDKKIESNQVSDFIEGLGQGLLVEVTLFDAYEGERIGPGRRSLAYRLVYQSPDRTLTDEEVNLIHERIMNRVLNEFNAQLQT